MLMRIVQAIAVVAGAIFLTMALSAAAGGCGSGTPDRQNSEPIKITKPNEATTAVCRATRNAYLQDAIPSNITGKAIRNLSDRNGVNWRVRASVHALFDSKGNAPRDYEESYKRVIRACDDAGWKVGG